MDISQLRYFLMVYETLNYTQASERLLVSRQAVSQSIKNLEEELGGDLFTNNKNHLLPTRLGNALYERGQQIVADFDKMQDDMQSMRFTENELHVAVCASLLPFFAPELQAYFLEFRKKFPGVKLNVELLSGDDLFEALSNHEIDAGIILYMDEGTKEFQVTKLYSYLFGVTIGQPHPFYNRATLTLKDLEGQKFSTIDSKCKTMSKFMRALENANVHVECETVVDVIEAYNAMHKGDLLVPNGVWETGQLATISKDLTIADFVTTWDVCILSNYKTNELDTFIKYLQEEYKHRQDNL